MSTSKIHIEFPGRIVFIGFGSIGQGTLPLVLRHIGIPKERLTIITGDDRGRKVAESYGVKFVVLPLTRDNFRRELDQYIGRGDFVLNVSVDVSSIALIKFCWSKGAMYLDTCIEPWPGGYTDATIPHAKRTNYALREEALGLRANNARAPTAVITHGANPGLVSHFVKQALLNVAADTGVNAGTPKSKDDWAQLSRTLGIKAIHIAERDTQLSSKPKEFNEFVNTWSVDGFVSEGQQPSELGWGTHEKNFPRDGKRFDFGCGAAIYLMQPGAATRVRTWTPKAGHFFGFLITHGEAISIADYLTVRQSSEAVYRPTVHYSYHPSDSAIVSLHEFAGRNWHLQDRQRILLDEITSGIDELGVLLAGHKKNAYWFGSQLSIQEARALAPHNNATSLQVTVSCLSGMIWAMENPNAGLVEPDEIDYVRNLEICKPYLGTVSGTYSDWTPLHDRERLFPEDLDKTDPWQFKNVRV
ncbi:MAG TPA: saccharopine dehydrogenase C-terminal domain-containing protein [Steroidobacteraceae bacterium]|nr:saccharopine dehydrogenase C-terminal domain-containing protein [Steroidobacteraceae bacterium]